MKHTVKCFVRAGWAALTASYFTVQDMKAPATQSNLHTHSEEACREERSPSFCRKAKKKWVGYEKKKKRGIGRNTKIFMCCFTILMMCTFLFLLLHFVCVCLFVCLFFCFFVCLFCLFVLFFLFVCLFVLGVFGFFFCCLVLSILFDSLFLGRGLFLFLFGAPFIC